MTAIVTGSRRIVCNVGNPQPKDPVAMAKARTQEAVDQEEQITQAQERADTTTHANETRKQANACSKDAYDCDPNSAEGRKAHQTAAIAHSDAKAAFGAVAAESSGNDLETRAKAARRADEHDQAAKRHKMMAGKPSLNTGSKTVDVDVVCNVWSDAAREASAEARAASEKAGVGKTGQRPSFTAAEAGTPAKYHEAMARYHAKAADRLATKDSAQSKLHADAWAAHNKAALLNGGEAQK
jgi:hypothetical protein